MGKKLLIAAGTGQYDHLAKDLQRPSLEGVVDSVAELFTRELGYSRVLEEISCDPTSDRFLKELDKWLGSPERDQSDWVTFYYTGHGELLGETLVSAHARFCARLFCQYRFQC